MTEKYRRKENTTAGYIKYKGDLDGSYPEREWPTTSVFEGSEDK